MGNAEFKSKVYLITYGGKHLSWDQTEPQEVELAWSLDVSMNSQGVKSIAPVIHDQVVTLDLVFKVKDEDPSEEPASRRRIDLRIQGERAKVELARSDDNESESISLNPQQIEISFPNFVADLEEAIKLMKVQVTFNT